MLLLTSVNDQLQIVTSAAGSIDVHVTWVDTKPSDGTITPGRKNSAIVTAATISVADTPPIPASQQRNIKTLHVRNKHATVVNDVTIKHSDGTVAVEIYKRTLQPQDEIELTDQGGIVNLRV
jgi:hypothetical protein